MSQTIDQVFRDFNTEGVPASGEHLPDKKDIRSLLKMIQNSGGQSITRNTLAALNAVIPPNENYMGMVLTGAGAGYYSRSGGAWLFGRPFPDTIAGVTLSGSGTAQTGMPSPGVNPASVLVYFAEVTTPNTDTLKLTIGGVQRDVVNAAGNPLSAGEWTGGVLFRINPAGKFQLINDAGAAVAAAASASDASGDAERAEEAAERAETASAGVEYPVSYGGIQLLGPGQRAQARENVRAVGYDPQSIAEPEQEQARLNIGADYSKLATLLASSRRITYHDPGRNKMGHALGILPNGRIVVCYRSATTHNIAVSRMEAIFSDDGGLTWSAPVVVASLADHDYRNYSAGVTQNGVFVVATEDITVSTGGASGNRTRFYFSLDGVAFAERTSAASNPAMTRIVPHGSLVLRNDGTCYFRCYHGHANPAANADGDQSLFSSSDDFQTATYSTIWDGPGLSGPNPAEPYTVALDATHHVSFMRREKTGDDTPLLMKSADGGITWGAPQAITNIAMGKNPPCLWYNSARETLYAIWPSRGQTHLADGATRWMFPFYYASISKAQLIAGGAVWRAQTPFAVFSPAQAGSFPDKPGGDGDSGHPHVFEAHGMTFMLYYSGSHGSLGSDLYIANLSVLIGI
ncbi:exo-alpha-sialidase [Devosia sp. MC521]|uniref:exo-alpha-sialidase n=1 Tax=Devosia sp. MC521 TaxID=2759954 RepID=UPI0015FC5CAB|nr:exo-alpha-sialidase [Devosia sp. MC521]MBJ6986951.1 exo-alpha-sialidase [Devosia sp. MC521]QMW63975.1 exo-alpha-sialidase [Devosia sp. MC521]